MDKAPQTKKTPSKTTKKKRKNERRTNMINAAIIAVFALVVLGCLFYSNGLYLPFVTAMTADDYHMDAVTFNYFYRDCYDSFQSAYGEMLDAYGTLDESQGLDEQEYSDDYTWAQFFYDAAVQNAERSVVIYLAALDDGYALTDESRAEVDAQIESLRVGAKANGYTLVNNYLRSHYGKGASLKSYKAYLELQAVANGFSTDCYSSVAYAEEALSVWFAENYPDAGSDYDYDTVNFRMIYIPFSGYEYDEETGYYDYTEEAKQSAMVQLQSVSTSLVEGDQSEESFAELAEQCSSYKADEGGLYENAVKDDDNLETQVLSWIFGAGRYGGETTYIEAVSGDYLLYWVDTGMPAWQYLAQQGLKTEAWNAWYEMLAENTDVSENPNIMRHLYFAV